MTIVASIRTALLSTVAFAALTTSAFAQTPPLESPAGEIVNQTSQPVQVAAAAISSTAPLGITEQVTVTARRREENAQDVPIALTVVTVDQLDLTGTYNVNTLSQLAPSLQFSSSNGRNTGMTIRGFGTSFGLANDGLEAGVGIYVDEVYQGRPAAATFDFLDVSQAEVLRGPQGTLFGKNTTAGAINIGIKKPTFDTEFETQVTAGNYGFFQGRGTISGPLVGNILAARLSVTGTLRDGLMLDTTTGKHVNNQNNIGLRGQLLYQPNENFNFRLVADWNHQEADCCGIGIVRVGVTLKSADSQFAALAAQAGYTLPTSGPFDRKIDLNSPLQANQTLGGISGIANWNLGDVTVTSVTAWRTWNWDPLNDRDYTRLAIQTASSNFDNQNQYSEELRVASNGKHTVDYVGGLYYYQQIIDGDPLSAWGADATRWLLTPNTLTGGTPLPANLLDGYTARDTVYADTKSYAAFGQLTWNITDELHFTPGLRYTYETKIGRFDRTVSGGNPRAGNAGDVTKLQSIARDQHYSANFDDGSLSGQANVSYDLTAENLVYATYAKGHKSGGINLSGIPVDAAGNNLTSTAVVKPENATTYEIGTKNQFFERRVTLNVAAFINEVENYQVNVVDSGPGALRGYLANAAKASSHGLELDATYTPSSAFSSYISGAWTEGKYDDFKNGPCPLEKITSSTAACDLTGKPLAGLSRWALSGGAEYRVPVSGGTGYLGVDASYHSSNFADVSDSRYLLIPGYTLVNLRLGFASSGAWEAFVWVKNVFDTDYFSYLQAQTGNSGAVVGLLGDPRTVGVTVRAKY